MDEVRVESLVGLETRQPLVQMTLKGTQIQMSPEEARQIAYSLIECAEASLRDCFLVDFMTQRIKTDLHGAAVILQEFRSWRQAYEEKQDDK